MGLLDDVSDLFPHEITLAAWTGDNRNGEPEYGEAITYAARIERGNRQVQDARSDRAIVPKHKIFIGAPVVVDVRDQLVLPEMYGSRNSSGVFEAPTVTIIDSVPIYDETEHVCTVIYC